MSVSHVEQRQVRFESAPSRTTHFNREVGERPRRGGSTSSVMTSSKPMDAWNSPCLMSPMTRSGKRLLYSKQDADSDDDEDPVGDDRFNKSVSSAAQHKIPLGKVMVRPPHREWMQPDKFDGYQPWLSFYRKFVNCIQYKGWDEVDKLAHLKASLKGGAELNLWM